MKRILFRDEEYFYKKYRRTAAPCYVIHYYKKRKRTIFNWRRYKCIGAYASYCDDLLDKKNISEAILNYLQKDRPILVECSPEVEALYK